MPSGDYMDNAETVRPPFPASNPEISSTSCRRLLESKAIRNGTGLLNRGTERLRFEYATLRRVNAFVTRFS